LTEVTLINPLTTTRRMPPLGLLYVASYLEKHGISVKVLDSLSQRKEEYISESPYTGITCMSNQFPKVRQIVKEVKEKNPNTTVVVGGVHPTVATREVISESNIDVAVVGEGERAMVKIVQEGIHQGIVHGELIQNLDEIPFPARHLIDMKLYLRRNAVIPFMWTNSTTIMTSRGCPWRCNFCINSKSAMFGRKVRFHSVSYILEEVERLIDYGAKALHVLDDTFTFNRKRVLDICEGLKWFDLKWFTQARVDTVDKEKLQAMKDAGCWGIGFGFESGSQKVLDALNKHTTVEQNIKASELCKEIGIKVLASIIIGNPEETREDIELTDKLLEKIKPDYTLIWHLTPYQGTVIYDQAMEHGWIKGASLVTDEPQMEINFTFSELKEIRERLNRKYNSTFKTLRPYLNKYFIYDMLRLLSKKPYLLFGGVERWKLESRTS